MSKKRDTHDSDADIVAEVSDSDEISVEDSMKPAAGSANTELTVESLAAELEDTRDQLLRTVADFDNFRKRSRREHEEQRDFAKLPLMRDVIDVLDNLERALHTPGATEEETWVQGVRMVAVQLRHVLTEHGCLQMETIGKPFDPNLHESIQMVYAEGSEPGTILEEMQVGYQLNDRVVRPAKVIVATNQK